MDFLRQYFNTVLYVQLSPRRLMLRDPRSRACFDEVPEVAIHRPASGRATVRAVGAEARMHAAGSDVVVVNPLAHPRTLVSDFVVAEQLLKFAIRRLYGGRPVFRPSPEIVMHPVDDYEGGLTAVEIRALQELALGAGASRARVWQGPALGDDDLLQRRYPPAGRMLA